MSETKLKAYRLRIPAISLQWVYEFAASEEEALEKIVKRINSKTVDYSARECWEIEEVKGGGK